MATPHDRNFITAPPPLPVSHALPPRKTLQKRPLTHPPLPPPSAPGIKTIYISASTPFVTALKRITSALDSPPQPSSSKPKKRKSRGANSSNTSSNLPQVRLKATGKAVDKCLQLAGFLAAKKDGAEYAVRVETGTVGVVDDVVDVGEGMEGTGGRGGGRKTKRRRVGGDGDEDCVREKEMGSGEVEGEEVEMVTRMVSLVEVIVERKGGG